MFGYASFGIVERERERELGGFAAEVKEETP